MHTAAHPPDSFRRYYQKLRPVFKKPGVRTSTATVFSFLSISLFAWYAIRPTAQTILYLRREIADKTIINEQMENKITALIEAQSTYETIKARLPVVEQALPKNPDAIILARQLRNLASYSGASISALQIPSLPFLGSEATPGAKLASQPKQVVDFPVALVLRGSYRSLKTFIDGLLTMRRITAIDAITLKRSAKAATDDELQLSLKLSSYYSTQ